MFSGKTTELIRRLKRYIFAQYRCLIIKYLKDTRYSEESVATHDGQSLPAVSCTVLYETKPMLENFDVIGIDEGQFVSEIRFKFSTTCRVCVINFVTSSFKGLFIAILDPCRRHKI